MQNPPPILIQKTPQGLLPYGPYSGPAIDDLMIGQVFTAKPRKNRTLPRNGAYWAGLHTLVDNSDAWPTAKHAHEDIKRLAGYVDYYHNPFTGRDEIRPQSTAFDKMSEAEFAAFFRLAQLRVSERMGFDPWAERAVK
jgi:hypothetical protein